ncbi:MAG TPA: prepilin-type N-terminal cleavage/methylation domain-containing protein, partial [Terriglobales bacterium]|nr:prepilin-type N-terminal cleavage/methylation domain-containing protein [Terriglobales bacterium]
MRAIRKGFTLIEVLVVIVVLGILSGIAIAKFVNTKEAAYIASMKADLRNLAIYEQNCLIESQGSYFAGNGAAQGFV